MDGPADVSSVNRSGWHLLDGCASTRNRKVEASNPDRPALPLDHRIDPRIVAAIEQRLAVRSRLLPVCCPAKRSGMMPARRMRPAGR